MAVERATICEESHHHHYYDESGSPFALHSFEMNLYDVTTTCEECVTMMMLQFFPQLQQALQGGQNLTVERGLRLVSYFN